MSLIRRDDYTKWLDEFRQKKLVKALTGLGKSYAMLTYSRLRRIGAECQTPRASCGYSAKSTSLWYFISESGNGSGYIPIACNWAFALSQNT